MVVAQWGMQWWRAVRDVCSSGVAIEGCGIKQKKQSISTALVGLPGFEPRMTGPESVVLPLHHSPMFLFDGAKVEQYFGFAKKIAKKIQKKFISLLRFLLIIDLKYIKHTDYEKH